MENLKGKICFVKLDIDGRVILKLNLDKNVCIRGVISSELDRVYDNSDES